MHAACIIMASMCIHTVAVISLVPLPMTVPEELPLNVCTVAGGGGDYIDVPLTFNLTVSSEEGIAFTDNSRSLNNSLLCSFSCTSHFTNSVSCQ